MADPAFKRKSMNEILASGVNDPQVKRIWRGRPGERKPMWAILDDPPPRDWQPEPAESATPPFLPVPQPEGSLAGPELTPETDVFKPILDRAKDGARVVGDVIADVAGTAGDFQTNFQLMKDAGTVDADKYYHCRANCQGARRGRAGYLTAKGLSELREVYGWFKGDSSEDRNEDQIANRDGRNAGRTSTLPCGLACEDHRVDWLDKKYWGEP